MQSSWIELENMKTPINLILSILPASPNMLASASIVSAVVKEKPFGLRLWYCYFLVAWGRSKYMSHLCLINSLINQMGRALCQCHCRYQIN